jgi:AcrR family transcriptional regulator
MSKQATSAQLSSAKVLALPTKQARAQKTRDKLLSAGAKLLKDHSLDDISIAQIAREAGCSVGVFYFRFQDKDAFFRFLLDQTLHDIRTHTDAIFASQSVQGQPESDILAQCIGHFINIMREHGGLIRAAQGQTRNIADSWQPVREMGAWLIERYLQAIADSHSQPVSTTLQRNGSAAFQIVSGVLVNAVLNRPPHMNLDSPDLEFWLYHVASQCLSVSQLPGAIHKKTIDRKKRA